MKWLEKKCRESDAFSWGITALGIAVIVAIAFL